MTTSQVLRSTMSRSIGVGFASLILSRAKCESLPSDGFDATNPLTDHRSVPRFDRIEASHVVPAITNDLQQLKKNFDGKMVRYLIRFV